MYSALSSCNLREVSALLVDGVCPNSRHCKGLTPLSLAWQADSFATAELLLDHGADPNGTMLCSRLGRNNTVLHLISSTRGDNSGWIRFFGHHGADPDALNSMGQTPMCFATSLFSARKIAALAAIGADCTLSYRSLPVLHHAAIKHSASLVSVLLAAGTPVNCRDHLGRTVLFHADSFRANKIMDILFDAGANPNARDDLDNTPLHVLVAGIGKTGWHHVHLEPFLLAGAKLNLANKHGDTILHNLPWSHTVAANLVWLNKLLAAGADPNAKNIKGHTPLDVALQWGVHSSLVDKLLEFGARQGDHPPSKASPLS